MLRKRCTSYEGALQAAQFERTYRSPPCIWMGKAIMIWTVIVICNSNYTQNESVSSQLRISLVCIVCTLSHVAVNSLDALDLVEYVVGRQSSNDRTSLASQDLLH